MMRILLLLIALPFTATGCAEGEAAYASTPTQQPAPAMTVEQTREIMQAYAASHDPSYITEDAVFTHMGTGERHEGREAIGEMLNWIYHVAFDARAEDPRLIIGEGEATLEATFTGTHTGEFAGILATGREVRVPLCVTYELDERGITGARVYMLASVMMQQLGAIPAPQEG